MFAKAKHAAFLIVVEVFLVKSLLSCESLNKDGILGDFLYVALRLCAILYHFFVVAASSYIFAKHICKSPGFQFLRGSNFHIALLICLMPVCRYTSSLGFGNSESCERDAADEDDSDDENRPLSRSEFLGKHTHFENSIQNSLTAMEARILHAVIFGDDLDPAFKNSD
mmetsp:Transcript_12559/g.20452  ORF Transcript_12559/g.20452 Transcript_12559/m.20452 type:complete len:168 (-) Transcript_12559:229-732(-)